MQNQIYLMLLDLGRPSILFPRLLLTLLLPSLALAADSKSDMRVYSFKTLPGQEMASDTPISNIGASLGYTATQAAPKLAFSLTVTNRNAFEVMLLNPADYLSIVLYDYTGQLMELAVESLPPVKINSKSPVPSRSFAILSARALTKNGDHDIELRQEVKIPPNGSLRFECAIEEILVKLGVSQGKIIRGLDPGQYSMNLTLTLIGAGQVGSKIARVEKAVLHLR